MQPLATSKRMMTWISMCPPDESTNAQRKLAYTANTVTIAIFMAATFVSSVVFFSKFLLVDFDGAVYALLFAMGEFGVLYILTVALSMRHQIDNIYTSLACIYNSRKFDDSKSTDKKVKFDKILFKIKMLRNSNFWPEPTAPANGCGKFISNILRSQSLAWG